MMRLYTLIGRVPHVEVASLEQAKIVMQETSTKEEVAVFVLEADSTYRYFVGVDGRVYTPESLRRFHRGNDFFHLTLAFTPLLMMVVYALTRSERPVWWLGLLMALAVTIFTAILVVERTRQKVLAQMLGKLVTDTINEADPHLRDKGLQPNPHASQP
jgi:hypothetical protein